MLALKVNRMRLAALFLAAALLVPMWPAARAETTIDPPAQEEPSVPSVPPVTEDPSPPSSPEGGDGLGSAPPDNEVATTPDTTETLPLTVPPSSRAAAPNDTLLHPQAKPGDAPSIRLESNLVLDALGTPNGFVEVAVQVTTSQGEALRSLSLTVQYSDLLTPVDWATGGDVTLGQGNFSTHIPTKHSDRVTGAAAYGGGTDRSLYIEAESIEPATLTSGIVAVVRFRYDVNNKPLLYQNGEIVQVTNVGAYDPDDPATAQTVSVGNLFPLAPDVVAATEPRARQAVWYESAANSFYYVNGYDGTASMQDTVTLPVNGVDTSFQKPKTAGATVLAVRADKDPTTGTAAEYYSFLSNLIPSANITTAQVSQLSYDQSGGGITLDDVATVVFFDWDDTLLGTYAIAKTLSANQLSDRIEAFNKRLYHGYVSKVDAKANSALTATLPTNTATQYYYVDSAAPLTYKKAYNFGGWVSVQPSELKDTFTAYSDMANLNAAIFNFATAIKPADGWGSMVLKAGYVAWDGIDKQSAGSFDSAYTVQAVSHSQYGSSNAQKGTYGISISLKRENTSGVGVSRIETPILLVTIQEANVGATELYLSVPLAEESDFLTGEVVVTKALEYVDISVVDFAQQQNWIAATKRLVTSSHVPGTPTDPGYIFYGTVAFVNDIARQKNAGTVLAGDWGNLVASVYNDIAVDYTAQPDVTSSRNHVNSAKYKIALASYGMLGNQMTANEIQGAISMRVGSIINDTTYNTARNALDIAIAGNGGNLLTLAQIEYAITH